MNKPNFFLLGSAKCGSSSLYYYLKQHPDIYLTTPKEPNYFTPYYQEIKSIHDYINLFNNVALESVIGECSHGYLSHQECPEIIHTFFPEAKFAVILRSPTERAYSLFLNMRRFGFETASSFEKALAKEEGRSNSLKFRRKLRNTIYSNYLYFNSGLFGQQLANYLEYFKRDQFIILTLSDLKRDPLIALRAVFDFLNVNQDFTPTLQSKSINKSYDVRSVFMQKISNSRLFKSCGVSSLIDPWNRHSPEPMKVKTRDMLNTKYVEDQELLRSLTGFYLL